jgi:hypothetical protein
LPVVHRVAGRALAARHHYALYPDPREARKLGGSTRPEAIMASKKRKPKQEAELVKEALRMGMEYGEKRGVVEFEATDSQEEKIEFVYRLLVHDGLIQPLAKHDLSLPNMKHKLARWGEKQLPADHPLRKAK